MRFDNVPTTGYHHTIRDAKKSMNTIDHFMKSAGFDPNEAQREAILHENGPLYLPAGPGSGKTRILLWRSFNLIVFRGVDPSRIFLSTFTDKAALQLKNGLYSLLAVAGEELGKPFDAAEIYVGTLHSLSARLLSDRRFSPDGKRIRPTILMDDLAQTLYLYRGEGNRAFLRFAKEELGIEKPEDFYVRVQRCFGVDHEFASRFEATRLLVEFFNRVSEEAPILEDWKQKAERLGLSPYHEGVRLLLDLYGVYCETLKADKRVDLSLVQKAACEAIEASPMGGKSFDEVIIDEYQDTNTVQERLIFDLSARSKNLCVVGDDDQALYRFRGATVENFVRFPERVRARWGCETRTIPITRNYRSRTDVVRFSQDAILTADWADSSGGSPYRIEKRLEAVKAHDGPAVFSSPKISVEEAAEKCALLTEKLIKSGKVGDANRIAFLFPSVKSKITAAFITALEAHGIKAYAPRAGSFLETEDARLVFGLIGKTIGFGRSGFMNEQYKTWTHSAEEAADNALQGDPTLKLFIDDRRKELSQSGADYSALEGVCIANGWKLDEAYIPERMKRVLSVTPGISEKARRSILSKYFDAMVKRRTEAGNPYSLGYVLSRAAGLDWSLLDHFYRLCAFGCLKRAFDLAEGLLGPVDEGPICNLSLISGYICRYGEEYGELIPPNLAGGGLEKLFFGQYLSLLYRLDESEYEDPEDPFPKGRVAFLTIHQAKGLEFPVVFVPRTARRSRTRVNDTLIESFLEREREPLERRAAFDEARRFYVAFSRAENLLVIPRVKSHTGKEMEPLLEGAPDLGGIDPSGVPESKEAGEELPRNYSYTGDYTFYETCPRRYMAFRKYGFSASRTQHAVFGILVHRTIEDLHRRIMERRML